VICIPSIVEGLGAGWGHDGTHTQTPSWPRFPHRNEGLSVRRGKSVCSLCSRGVSCLQQTITAPKVQRLPLRDMSGGYPTKGLLGLFLTAPNLPLTILVETSGSSTSPRAYTSKTRACRYISRPAPTSAVATAMPPVHSRVPGYVIYLALRSNHGWQWISAVMDGCAADWWKQLQLDRKQASAARAFVRGMESL
jgi:hypothetical protein